MGVVKRRTRRLDSLPPLESEDFARRCKDNIEIKDLNVLICFTLFSFFLYFLDIVWDIDSLNKFYTKKHFWYFGCTLAFLVIPVAVIATRSFRFKSNKTSNTRDFLPKEENICVNRVKWTLGIFTPIPRYVSKLFNLTQLLNVSFIKPWQVFRFDKIRP